MLNADTLGSHARALGFDRCGIAPATPVPELGFLREWLERGFAGEMTYLSRTAAERADVRAVLPTARSVVALATVYNVDRPYSTELRSTDVARLARYAWGDDYHDVIARRMRALLAWMQQEASEPFEACAYVDTGPVQEKVLAQQAGLGWIGKHTCLINPDLGSWLFLSVIVTSLALEPDAPSLDQCGTCTLCIEACPTDAIVAPWVLDARRCLSYLTIEVRGDLPVDRLDAVGSHVFGCDVCQDVCPWNAPAARSADPAWMPRDGLDRPPLAVMWSRPDADLSALLRNSAMRRAGVRRLRRNLAVTLANDGSETSRAALDPRACERLDAPSLDDPLVARHVERARAKLTRG